MFLAVDPFMLPEPLFWRLLLETVYLRAAVYCRLCEWVLLRSDLHPFVGKCVWIPGHVLSIQFPDLGKFGSRIQQSPCFFPGKTPRALRDGHVRSSDWNSGVYKHGTELFYCLVGWFGESFHEINILGESLLCVCPKKFGFDKRIFPGRPFLNPPRLFLWLLAPTKSRGSPLNGRQAYECLTKLSSYQKLLLPTSVCPPTDHQHIITTAGKATQRFHLVYE